MEAHPDGEWSEILPSGAEGADAPRSLLKECWALHTHRHGDVAMAEKREGSRETGRGSLNCGGWAGHPACVPSCLSGEEEQPIREGAYMLERRLSLRLKVKVLQRRY